MTGEQPEQRGGQRCATPASQAATVVQNAVAAAPSTSSQTTTAAVPATTGTGATPPLPTFTGPFAWLEQLIYNTYNNYPTGGWGVGLTGGSSGNLNTMRQVLQAYFAVGLANFGFGMGQQLITPAQATALFNPLRLVPRFRRQYFPRLAAPQASAAHRLRPAVCRPSWARPALSGGCRCPRVGKGRRLRRWKRSSWPTPHALSHRSRMECSTVFRWRATPVLEPVLDAAAAGTS